MPGRRRGRQGKRREHRPPRPAADGRTKARVAFARATEGEGGRQRYKGQILHVPPGVAANACSDQRTGGTCGRGGAALRGGATATCGGDDEILSRISCLATCSLVVMSRVI
jgi:hypothetical protein